MLAGVSHDLRTVLTRFKLELALAGQSAEVKALQESIDISGLTDLVQVEQTPEGLVLTLSTDDIALPWQGGPGDDPT